MIVPRFLVMHHTARSRFAPLQGTPVPLGTKVEALAEHDIRRQVDIVDEVNGVIDIVRRRQKYFTPVSA